MTCKHCINYINSLCLASPSSSRLLILRTKLIFHFLTFFSTGFLPIYFWFYHVLHLVKVTIFLDFLTGVLIARSNQKGMDVEETNCSSGYGKPPWIFKGRALYQFHLVKAEIARAIIPKEFKLVEAFGYTLGGFFLANYNESPFGAFDELVVIAGIVWNPPTSHAWAAQVYVNSDEACRHGRKEFGLPSQVGRFTKSVKAVPKRPQRNDMEIHVAEIDGPVATNLYDIRLTSPVLKTNPLKWVSFGPNIRMSLPSFSGHTKHKPQLLKYSCQIECRVKPTSTAKVLRRLDQNDTSESQNVELNESIEKREMSISAMLSKPILALEFNCLKMEVEPPVVVSKGSHGF